MSHQNSRPNIMTILLREVLGDFSSWGSSISVTQADFSFQNCLPVVILVYELVCHFLSPGPTEEGEQEQSWPKAEVSPPHQSILFFNFLIYLSYKNPYHHNKYLYLYVKEKRGCVSRFKTKDDCKGRIRGVEYTHTHHAGCTGHCYPSGTAQHFH